MLFDLIESSHKSDFFLRKGLFYFMRPQHVLSYHPIKVPWDERTTANILQTSGDMDCVSFGQRKDWSSPEENMEHNRGPMLSLMTA